MKHFKFKIEMKDNTIVDYNTMAETVELAIAIVQKNYIAEEIINIQLYQIIE